MGDLGLWAREGLKQWEALIFRVEHRMLESFLIAKSPTKAYVALQLRVQMGSKACAHAHTHTETDFR